MELQQHILLRNHILLFYTGLIEKHRYLLYLLFHFICLRYFVLCKHFHSSFTLYTLSPRYMLKEEEEEETSLALEVKLVDLHLSQGKK